MTNREICIALLKDMIDHGYYMFGETPEHMIDRIGPHTEFWRESHDAFLKKKGF